MKKIFTIVAISVFTSASFAAVAGTGPSPSLIAPNNVPKSPYSILHMNYGTSTRPSTVKPQVPPQLPPNMRPNNRRHPHNRRYYPVIYGTTYSGYDDGKTEINIQNNYYNESGQIPAEYQNNMTGEDAKQNLQKQAQDDIERAALKKKYASILNSKTTSNEKMCKTMASKFPKADYDELDRVLNKLLYLNCNISQFRELK